MLIALAILLNMASLVTANNVSQEYLACIDKSGGVTAEMLDCISAELTTQDARLNENYKRLMSMLTGKRKQELLEAQRAWLKFRDANCGFYHDPKGGSAAHLAGNECFLNATADRAAELRNLINDK
jgi:uncharacterized protein YecT (DUF1311 family)